VSARSSADAAEMAQLQRIGRVYPPLCNLYIAEAVVREESAENAKTNAIRINAKAQGSKDAKGEVFKTQGV